MKKLINSNIYLRIRRWEPENLAILNSRGVQALVSASAKRSAASGIATSTPSHGTRAILRATHVVSGLDQGLYPSWLSELESGG